MPHKEYFARWMQIEHTTDDYRNGTQNLNDEYRDRIDRSAPES